MLSKMNNTVGINSTFYGHLNGGTILIIFTDYIDACVNDLGIKYQQIVTILWIPIWRPSLA